MNSSPRAITEVPLGATAMVPSRIRRQEPGLELKILSYLYSPYVGMGSCASCGFEEELKDDAEFDSEGNHLYSADGKWVCSLQCQRRENDYLRRSWAEDHERYLSRMEEELAVEEEEPTTTRVDFGPDMGEEQKMRELKQLVDNLDLSRDVLEVIDTELRHSMAHYPEILPPWIGALALRVRRLLKTKSK